MPALLLAWFSPIDARLASGGAGILITALLFALGGLGAWKAADSLAGLIDDRAAAATDAVDAKWRVPDCAISAAETTCFWGADRSALRLCEKRRAATADAIGCGR